MFILWYTQKMKKHTAVTVLRVIHSAIVLYLVTGIGYIYYLAYTKRVDPFGELFVISLLIEGLVIYLNRGNCPFGYVQRLVGDTTPFFDLILPHRYAKYAVKCCAVITLIGMILLGIRLLV
jgi:hypothetical protein